MLQWRVYSPGDRFIFVYDRNSPSRLALACTVLNGASMSSHSCLRRIKKLLGFPETRNASYHSCYVKGPNNVIRLSSPVVYLAIRRSQRSDPFGVRRKISHGGVGAILTYKAPGRRWRNESYLHSPHVLSGLYSARCPTFPPFRCMTLTPDGMRSSSSS